MSGTTPKIRLRGVTKRFGDKLVLDGIDLDVAPRTSMVVIGGSGSGKSVLLKCILGLITPDSGSIEIDGQDVLRMQANDRERVRAGIGMLFQNGALFDSLPVAENVAFGLLAQKKATRAEARKRAEEVLAQVGLAASVGDLSPPNSPAACRSASPWPAPSPPRRTSCSSTNPPRGWTRSWAR